MTQDQQPVTPVQETALRTLVTWRKSDKEAIAHKQDRDAQRAEYRNRVQLRNVADKLEGEEP